MEERPAAPEEASAYEEAPEPVPPRYRLTGVTAVCCALAHGWRVHCHANRWTGPRTRIDWGLAARLLDENPQAIYLDVLIEGIPDWVHRRPTPAEPPVRPDGA